MPHVLMHYEPRCRPASNSSFAYAESGPSLTLTIELGKHDARLQLGEMAQLLIDWIKLNVKLPNDAGSEFVVAVPEGCVPVGPVINMDDDEADDARYPASTEYSVSDPS